MDPLERRLPPRASVGICPNSYFLSHPFRVEDFPSPGGCDRTGIQFSAIPQPVSDLMGFYSDFAGLPWRIFSEAEEGPTLGRSSLVPGTLGLPGLLLPTWVPGALLPGAREATSGHHTAGLASVPTSVKSPGQVGGPRRSRGWSLGWG